MTVTEAATADFHRIDHEPEPSLALVRSSPFAALAELRSHLDDLEIIAQALCKSTLLPRDMQSPANLKLVLMQGLEMGFSPIQAIRASFIITSKDQPPKVGYYVAALVALVRASGKCRFFRVDETTATRCRVACARNDEAPDVVHNFELTMEQAQKANLDKKWEYIDGKSTPKIKYPWITAPSDMLLARCSGRAVKSVFQDVVFGMATPDELDDLVSAETLERADGFAPVPVATARRARVETIPPAPGVRITTAADVVDAEIVEEPPTFVPDKARIEAAFEANRAKVNEAREVAGGSGDRAWDELIAMVATFASIDTSGWVPADLLAEWHKRVAAAATKSELNALAPWIGEASKRAASSKNCSDVAAEMKTLFNTASAELGKRAKAGAK